MPVPTPDARRVSQSLRALSQADPDLQRMHALVPWLVTWDDHEVDNDYANDRSEHLDAQFLVRRAAAYQAYYEHMPLRHSAQCRVGRTCDSMTATRLAICCRSICWMTGNTAHRRPARDPVWGAFLG